MNIQWIYTTALTNGQTKIVPIGAEASAINIADCTRCLFITWGFISSHAAQLKVDGAVDYAFTNADNLVTQGISGATYSTPYGLTSPTGDTGAVVLTMPFIRITISDQATTNHSYTRLFVRVW